MSKFILTITERNHDKVFSITSEDTENAIYEIDNTLQLYMGIKFIRNFRKHYLYKNLDNIIDDHA